MIPDRAPPRLSFSLPLDPARLLRARQRIRDYLHLQHVDAPTIEAVVQAVEEAMTNAVRHSRAQDELDVRLYFEQRDLHAEVRDRGRGFDVEAFDGAERPDPLAPGGRGLYLIAQLMDELDLHRDGGLKVSMVKHEVLPDSPRQASPEMAVADGAILGGEGYREERQRAFVEEIDEGFAALDWEYRVVYANRAGLELYGKDREGVLGRSIWELFPSIGESPVGRALREAMEMSVSSIVEFRSHVIGSWLECRFYPTSSGVSFYLRDIDQRKRVEHERDEFLASLRASEERYRSIVETSTAGIVIADPNGLISYANQRFAKMLGYELEELIGTYSSAVIDADFRAGVEQARTQLGTGEVVHDELKFRHKDGRPVWTLWGATPVRDAAGKHVANLAMHVDITERKRLEKELARKEEQSRHLIRYAAAGIFEIDFRGPKFVHVNDFMCQYSGYSRDELLATNPLDLLDEDSRARFRERMRRTLAGEQIEGQVEYRFRTKQGQGRWAILDVTPTFEDGRPVGAFVVGHDVTERKLAEEALRESEATLRTVLENSTDGINMLDLKTGRYVFMNDAQVALTGFTQQEINDISSEEAHERVHPDDREISLEQQRRVAAGEDVNEPVEYRWKVKGGEYRWFSDRRKLVRDADGKPVALVGVSRDVTERKREEAVARQELETRALLLSAAHSLASRTSLTAALDTLTELTLRLTRHTRATVSLWDEESRCLEVRASRGVCALVPNRCVGIDQLSPPAQEVIRERASRFIDYDALPQGRRGVGESVPSHLALDVPLVCQDRLLGILAVDDPEERREFSEREVSLAEGIASQAAVAIANANLFEEQRRIALTLQESLVHPLPAIAGVELAAVSLPAGRAELVGGDFWDVVELADRRVMVVIGDVAGKGIAAAGLTETVRSTMRAFATVDPTPAFVLRKTNDLLLSGEPEDVFVTALVLVLDPQSGHISLGSAGHPPPIHLTAGSCAPLELAYGPPLGSFSSEYASAHARLGLDDYVVLYTDGVTEAVNGGNLFGERRLLETVERLRGQESQTIADQVRDAVTAFAPHLRDDLQVMVLRLR